MEPYPLPLTESERLEDVRSLRVLDTPAEEPFDGIVEIASALFEAPIALLTLIDAERQWFKAYVGVPFSGTCRSLAFCAHTIMSKETMVVEDLAVDPRFAAHPSVALEPSLRFYAGAPLISERRQCLGTLCILDVKPRSLELRQQRLLERLARQAMDALDMRKLVDQLSEGLVGGRE